MRTLSEYSIEDFRQYLTMEYPYHWIPNKTWDPIAKREIVCSGKARIHFDFDRRTKCLSIYLPKEANFVELLAVFISDMPKRISDFEKGFVPTRVDESQKSSCSAKELMFDNYLYAYVEGPVDEEQKSKITSYAKEKGINLVLRGDEYSAEKNRLENPESDKSPYDPAKYFEINKKIAPPSLSIKEIEQMISELRRLDLKKVKIDEIKDRLEPLFIETGYMISCPMFDPGVRVYRGVVRKNKPLRKSEIIYPNKDLIKKDQRVNRSGQSVFYCSSFPEISFIELGLKSGDFVAISAWETKGKLLVNNIGYAKNFWWNKNQHPNQLEEGCKLVERFFIEEFIKKIPEGGEHLYKMTIAIAERHLNQDGFGGLLYPSVATNRNGDNFALNPEYVDQHLRLMQVDWIEMLSVTNDSFKCRTLDRAYSFQTDGLIQWTGQPPLKWTNKMDGELQLRAVDGKWVAYDNKGNPIDLDFIENSGTFPRGLNT